MGDKKERVQRYDRGRISKVEHTPQGFLRVTGAIARTGIQSYRNADGSERLEMRPPDEVFDAVSMQSFANAPVTDLHPNELVSPKNVRDLQRGVLAGYAKKDGNYLSAEIVIQDADLIAAVERGERRDVSCGYTCFLDFTPGQHDGRRYDAIQRAIIANHVALGPPGWGRAGPEVSLRMDGAALGDYVRQRLELMGKTTADLAKKLGVDRWAIESFIDGWWDALKPNSAPHVGKVAAAELDSVAKFLDQPVSKLIALVPVSERQDGGQSKPKTEPRKMEPVVIRIDGIEYKVDAGASPHIVRAIEKRDGEIAAAKKATEEANAKADRAQAQADAASKERDALQAKLDAATAPAVLDKAVTERLAIIEKARQILGTEEKLDGKSDQQIKIACIAKSDSTFDHTGRSPDYIDARFDAIRADALVMDGKLKIADALLPDGKAKPGTETAREKFIREQRERATKPLNA